MQIHRPCLIRQEEVKNGTIEEHLAEVHYRNHSHNHPNKETPKWAVWFGFLLVFGLIYGTIENIYEFQDTNQLIFLWIFLSLVLAKVISRLFREKKLDDSEKSAQTRSDIGSASCLNYRNEPKSCPFNYPNWCPYREKIKDV